MILSNRQSVAQFGACFYLFLFLKILIFKIQYQVASRLDEVTCNVHETLTLIYQDMET